jgi:protein arginine kinase activator
MEEKMCDLCGESPAVVHMKEVDNDKIRHLDLCQRCAETRGFALGDAASSGIQNIAEKLVSMAKDISEAREAEGVRCPSCGLLYSEFARTGRLGCPQCYTTFIAQLKPILRKAHGEIRHRGVQPREDPATRDDRQELRRLRAELDRAVRHEEFEKAAELRDTIEALEARMRTHAREEER